MTLERFCTLWVAEWDRIAAAFLAEHDLERFGWACHQRDIALRSRDGAKP
jgi:hypothetical protein